MISKFAQLPRQHVVHHPHHHHPSRHVHPPPSYPTHHQYPHLGPHQQSHQRNLHHPRQSQRNHHHDHHPHRDHHHHHQHHVHRQNRQWSSASMTQSPTSFDALSKSTPNNGSSSVNNHSMGNGGDVELMMELPPASPISMVSHASHATMHRSVSQTNNGVIINNSGIVGNGNASAGGQASRIGSAADEFLATSSLFQKPHSLSLSHATLTSREFSVEKTITAMGILALVAIIFSALSVLLLVQFNTMQDLDVSASPTMVVGVTGTRWYSDILDSGVVLTSFSLMLNLCCVVVCTGQVYFTAKVLKLPQGEERSCEFLQNTSGSRFLAVCSFFVSIPVFLVGLILYILLEFRTIPATVSSALIGLAILFMVCSFGHNVHLWRREKDHASGITSRTRHHPPPPLDGAFAGMNGGVPNQHSGQRHHHHNHHHQHRGERGASKQRFAYSNQVTGEEGDGEGEGEGGGGVDPLSISNLSTLV